MLMIVKGYKILRKIYKNLLIFKVCLTILGHYTLKG